MNNRGQVTIIFAVVFGIIAIFVSAVAWLVLSPLLQNIFNVMDASEPVTTMVSMTAIKLVVGSVGVVAILTAIILIALYAFREEPRGVYV